MPTRAQLKSRSRRRRAIGGKIFVKRNRFIKQPTGQGMKITKSLNSLMHTPLLPLMNMVDYHIWNIHRSRRVL